MGIHDILRWWNLIYAAPLLVSVVWIAATVFAGDQGHDHSGHHVGDTHDFWSHLLHGGDSADGTGGDGDAGGDHHSNFGMTISAILGLNQAPISLIIGVFMLCWGAFGLITNHVFARIGDYPAIYIWPSMGVTFLASALITRSMAAVVGRLIPDEETFGVSRIELVGALGKTIYRVDARTGTVNIKDKFGTVHHAQAKTEEDVEPLPSGTEVIIVDFDEEDKRYIVRKSII